MALPTWQAAGTQAESSGASISPAWPTHEADDIGLLIFQTANEAITLSGAAAADWTPLPDSPQGTGTGNDSDATRLTTFWARATSDAMGAPDTGATSGVQIGLIVTIRGCTASGNPYDVTAGDVETDTAETAVVVPGNTTTVIDCLIVNIVAHGIDGNPTDPVTSWANGDLSDVTERVDVTTAASKGGGFSVMTGGKAAAGAYGTSTATLDSGHTQGRQSIALQPPAAAASAAKLESPSHLEVPADIGDHIVRRQFTKIGRLFQPTGLRLNPAFGR